MTIPTPVVKIGLDVQDASIGNFFTLGSNVRGILGNEDYVLAGTILFDVTEYVRDINITRGRGRDFGTFPAGQASVTFNNHTRLFDPVNPNSPFRGNIVPRRELKIFSNDEVIFSGWIDDWNLSYEKDGNSIVQAEAYDATIFLAKQFISATTPPIEKTGARINRILNSAGVGWPQDLRTIDEGRAELSDFPIEDEQNALSYMQLVSESEPGSFFVGKDGHVTFVDRANYPTSDNLVEFGEGGIPFDSVRIVYGAELLYNEIVASRAGGGTAIASDIDSQDTYGLREAVISELLLSTDEQLVDLVVRYAIEYSQPEYRFESFDVLLHKLSEADQDKVLALELGSIVSASFTPNDIPPQIVRFLEVIRVEHSIDQEEHIVSLGFRSIEFAPLILGDAVFGKLGTGVLAY
jgi:hypothetical protein